MPRARRTLAATGLTVVGLAGLAALAPGATMAQDAAAQDRTAAADIIRGVIKARREAVIQSDLSAPVAEAPKRTGDAFKKGDLLLRFECEAQLAEAAAAAAAYRAARARHDSDVEMKAHDAAGRFDVSLSKADMEEADARARAARARAKRCDILAPYDGKVAELWINPHETPRVDQPLIKIVGVEEMELRLIVPSAWLVWLQPGEAFNFAVDETGETLAATVDRIGAEVDAVSRTVPIIARATAPAGAILPGMSGSATFRRPAG